MYVCIYIYIYIYIRARKSANMASANTVSVAPNAVLIYIMYNHITLCTL